MKPSIALVVPTYSSYDITWRTLEVSISNLYLPMVKFIQIQNVTLYNTASLTMLKFKNLNYMYIIMWVASVIGYFHFIFTFLHN